jgi:Ca-activated chloride channel family protein
MSFSSPWWLLTLIPVVALALAYLGVLRRRQRYAVRFATLPMLDKLVPERPAWRRHLPTTLVLIALTCLGLAAARPEVTVRVPHERATVIVAIDTSSSMRATDVPPSRIELAQAAAASFIDELPDTFNVGVVAFSGSTTVVAPPTTDHDEAERRLQTVTLAGGTAIGEAVHTSLDQIAQVDLNADGSRDGEPAEPESSEPPPPARIVLLSDGANTAGRSPEAAAAAASEAGVPVSTIAYGTPDGVIISEGREIPVPVDEETLASLASATGGRAYTAESGEQLRDVYDDIGSSIGWRTEPRDITGYLAALGLGVSATAGALSLRWFSRLI